MLSNDFNLRASQRSLILSMLDLNSNTHTTDVWKVLVFDQFTSKILYPLVTVNEMRDHAVTLHLSIESRRQAIPDVPVVYLVEATRENAGRIVEDLRAALYDQVYINFSSPVSRDVLEYLATQATAASVVSKIAKVVDQYSSFVALQSNLFTLAQPNCFAAFNDPRVTDAAAEAGIELTATGLFTALLAMGTIPIIRAPKNGAAALIAERLNRKLTDHLADQNNLLSTSDSHLNGMLPRPLLLLLDRAADLSVMLHHSWAYQGLLHDLLGMELNSVKTPGKEGQAPSEHNIAEESDAFIVSFAARPIPEVASALSKQLDEVKAEKAEFKRITGGEVAEDDILEKTKQLGAVITTLPKLEQKEKITVLHADLVRSLLDKIAASSIDEFVEMEEAILAKKSIDQQALATLLSVKGRPADKLRLYLLYVLNAGQPSPALEKILEGCGCSLAALKAVRASQALSAGLTTVQAATPAQAQRSVLGGFKGLLSDHMKNLMPQKKTFFVTRTLGTLMEQKDPMDGFVYFDPKQASKRATKPFKDAIVFMVGGGTYAELHNLQEYAEASRSRIIYGCSDLVSPDQFLSQLEHVAN